MMPTPPLPGSEDLDDLVDQTGPTVRPPTARKLAARRSDGPDRPTSYRSQARSTSIRGARPSDLLPLASSQHVDQTTAEARRQVLSSSDWYQGCCLHSFRVSTRLRER